MASKAKLTGRFSVAHEDRSAAERRRIKYQKISSLGVLKITAGTPLKDITVVDKAGKKLGHYRFCRVGVQKSSQSAHASDDPAIAEAGALLRPVDPARRAKTLEAARARGAIIADDIMMRADMVAGDELAAEFNMSRQAIDKRYRNGQLIGLATAKRGRKYPTAQFDRNGQLLPGITEVLAKLNGDGWAAWRFLSAEHIELGNRTGFLALKDGMVDDVMKLLVAIDHGAFS